MMASLKVLLGGVLLLLGFDLIDQVLHLVLPVLVGKGQG